VPNTAILTIDPEIPIRVVQPDGTSLRKALEDLKEGTAAAQTWSANGHEIMFVLIKASALGKADFSRTSRA
jgi:hypothetical protein